MGIDIFGMERYQSKYWYQVEHDLSESGVLPMTLRELLGPAADADAFMAGTALGYPLSEGSIETRSNIAAWYPGATPANITVTNGGSEANFLTLWSLLRRGDRLAFMLPNYMQGWGLGRFFGKATDTFRLKVRNGRWALDVDEMAEAVTNKTKAVMITNPNNPTGHVLTEGEMEAVITAADRVGAWIVADEIYRGAELEGDETSPSFWGRYDRVIITSGLSKAFGLPGLRVGWAVSTPAMIERLRERHDYTTLAPSLVSDRLAALAMYPDVRESIFARTKTIVRANYPALASWLETHGDIFNYVPPVAGAIQYVAYDLPISSFELVERIRQEKSVLLVAGSMFGLKRGLRFGFGFDIEMTLKGLTLVDEVLSDLAPAEGSATEDAAPDDPQSSE
jgi:aspartate/methionine/tyrosine aminotransferase